MAGTEDVSEKIAELLIQQGAHMINATTDVGAKVVQGVGSLTAIATSQLIEAINKNKELRRLLGLKGEVSLAEMNQVIHKLGQNSSSVMVADSDAKDYAQLLKEQGVLFAQMDKQNDNHKLFIFLNRDINKVENVSTILKAQRGQICELRSDLYFNSLAPDKVHAMEGVSAVEMELFRHYARQRGLLYTAIPRKEDYMIVCNEKDERKAREAMLHVGWALTGAGGARVREQVERRLAGRSAIQIGIEEAERELYIVSGVRPNQYVKISAEDYKLYKQNKQVASASRKDPDFFAKCMSACESLAHPVVMSAHQFREDLTPADMENAHSIDLFPENFDYMVEMQMTNRLVDLVSRKSSLDDEGNNTWGIWDPSVSYSSFSEYEFITDEDEREARQYEFEHFKQAAFYSQDHHASYRVDMKEKNIDYIIARAEEKRKQQAGQPRQHSGIDYTWRYSGNSAGREEDDRLS